MAGGDSLSLLSRTNCSAVEPLSGLWTPAGRKPAIPAVLSIDDGASSAHRSENIQLVPFGAFVPGGDGRLLISEVLCLVLARNSRRGNFDACRSLSAFSH